MEMTFGKYKGKTVEEVFKINPTYFKWMKEKDLTNKLEYQEYIETIPYEFPEQFEWEIDIRDGYRCWKCQSSIKIFLMFNPEAENDLREGFPLVSDLAYSKPKSIISKAKEFGVLLEERYGKEVESKYIMHISWIPVET